MSVPTVIVTGAAGFIGSAVCRYLRAHKLARVVGVDKMTYAASRAALDSLRGDAEFKLAIADICDAAAMTRVLSTEQPDFIMHLAAETHVDRSIDHPGDFLQANIVGTFSLLEMTRHYLSLQPAWKRERFRFLHVSTDEVYGSLGAEGQFSETTAYAPNSPYAASKAASDHLARAWHKTFGVPVVISNCSNNYGPYQFPEKLIPLCVEKALKGEALPIYGKGENIRDWLYVEDHAEALWTILTRGRAGEKYNVGGNAERRNIDLVKAICAALDAERPDFAPHEKLISFVTDRPGHDERYAIDSRKLQAELGWTPKYNLADGLRQTVKWYLDNRNWCAEVERGYAGARLGLGKTPVAGNA